MTMTPAQLHAAVTKTYPDRNWDQICQAFVYQAIRLSTGKTPKAVYASARAARLASKIVSKDYNAAPAGAIHYWIIGDYDHVGVALGNGFVAYGTAKGDTVEKWGTNLKVSHASSYPATYAGWARTNGANTGVAVSAYVVPIAANQRKAKALPVRIRTAAATTASQTGEIPANAVTTFIGYVTGQKVASGGVTSSIWYVVKAGAYAWAGGFTSQATTGLSSLDKITRTVGKDAVNRRTQPSTAAGSVSPDLKAGAVVEVKTYANGVAPSGSTNKIWYHLADGTWAWSGGFTSQSTTGLPLETVTITPPDSTLEQQVLELTAANTQLTAQVTSLTAQNHTLAAQVTALTSQVTTLTAYKTTVQTAVNKVIAEIKALL